MKYFVTGIGTDVGKTVVSAILTKKLKATYWKPVQSGPPADKEMVKALTGLGAEHFLEERWVLSKPASPHYSAALENIEIKLEDFDLPHADRLIVEGAGGLLVPFNEQHTYLDIIQRLGLPVVVVSRHYLGSINHTLLTLSVLKQAKVAIAGLVWNGDAYPSTEEAILKRFPIKVLGRVNDHAEMTPELVDHYAKKFEL